MESSRPDGLSGPSTPMISPTASLSSSDSIVSNCSDISVDTNLNRKGYLEDNSTDTNHEGSNLRLNGDLQHFSVPTHTDGELSNGCTHRDAASVVGNRHLSNDEKIELSTPANNQMDAQIWVPPLPEDQDDDLECSLANFDDDDEFGDGTKWGEPSCLSDFGEKGSESYCYKEEKQRAMNEVMNGRFKSLIAHLLKSVGVKISGDEGENWVDIATTLSWEAASFVKPNSIKNKAMDPDGYVKVKCIAMGLRSQSQVIRGSVFKKHAAHKHMQTTYKNPRLLLIKGALGMSSSNELSSFESMLQKNDSGKSIIEMIELCNPNVILVEKTVSRDIQERIFAKEMTLVLDMKLHRLERVSRCTGASILSSNALMGQKLKQCDSLHFEKFVEEHAPLAEGGKKPSKTLMFLEGCPTRLGCTILLKGSCSDELKRIKCVVQCAVVMAYHLILETSFLVDQKSMFSTVFSSGVTRVPNGHQTASTGDVDSRYSRLEEPSARSDSSCTINIPVSEGLHEEGPHDQNVGLDGNCTSSFEPYSPVILTGLTSLSASLKNLIGDSLPISSSTSGSLISSYLGLDDKDFDNVISNEVPITESSDVIDHCDVQTSSSDEEKVLGFEKSNSSSDLNQIPTKMQNSCGNDMDHMRNTRDISAVLDSESILVLMSSRNASKGTVCKQSQFSRIKFYRHFDVPLGKFLRNNLLNQKIQCTDCGEPPEAHFYYYVHHNKQLIFQVKRLSPESSLPGEAEGKLWMWSRCGICKLFNGNTGSKRKVLISMAARDLSFGKFLELSFSNYSAFSGLSSCGHSLQKDFVYFFGLGTMVAMFRHSSLATYSVSMPPRKLDFSNSIRPELLKEEAISVYEKGMSLFSEVGNYLQKIESRFTGSTLNQCGSVKEFSDIRELLKQEISQFEINIQNKVFKNGTPNEAIYKLLYLNQLLLEIVLESCIWEQRINSVLSSDLISTEPGTIDTEDRAEDNLGSDEEVLMNGIDGDNSNLGIINVEENEFPDKEIIIEDSLQGSSEQDDKTIVGVVTLNGSSNKDISVRHNCDGDENGQEAYRDLPTTLQEDGHITLASDIGDDVLRINMSHRETSPLLCKVKSVREVMWSFFPDIRKEYMKDLFIGGMVKYEPIMSHKEENLSTTYKLLTEEGSKLYIPLGVDDYVVSDYDGELSSIIACALALLKDSPIPAEYIDDHSKKEKTYEKSSSLTRLSSLNLTSPRWSSFTSWQSEPYHSDVSRLSSFDGLNLLDSLVSLGALHPEVSMGGEKLHGKCKYSVVCIYAGLFRELRNQCCPSELDFIASLSRCKNWDAKGGKSKSFFAKTHDDRFIIKEIKKTEYDSFMKFAPDYFKHMNQSFEQGNQTCLAKILGIYQVTVKQAKTGKELKHDLMVMENLTYGRNITRQYDLKGALHDRLITAAGDGSGDVLLDQNFVNDMNASPMYVRMSSMRRLQRAVWNDTAFLNSINVMDYSLLVGVDPQSHELVCGIIDYLRQFTWDKQLETWVKSSLVVPKNHLPTIVSPKEYKKRFRKFMSTHFLSVPDHWCSPISSSDPCKLYGSGDDESKKQQEE